MKVVSDNASHLLGAGAWRRAWRLCCQVVGMALLLALPAQLRAASWPTGTSYPVWSQAPTWVKPSAWPATGDWKAYTKGGVPIADPRVQDPSNGGTSPQGYVNVSSGATDESLPSVYYYYDATTQRLFMRFRLASQPNSYATGPNAGNASTSDPWSSAMWTVLISLNGDGWRNFAIQLDGSSGASSQPIDRLAITWSSAKSQSLDYTSDPNVHLISTIPTAFVDVAGGKILNFHSTNTPDATWANGSSETVWDYGTTRTTQLTTGSYNEYFVDYQIPLSLLDATAFGGPKIITTTPFAMLYSTSNSLQNPFQKDVALGSCPYVADPTKPAPFGDFISATSTIPQPILATLSTSGCGPATLSATVQSSLSCTNTGGTATNVASVSFYYYPDTNGNGIADDGGTWTLIGAGTASPTTFGLYTYSWTTSSLPKGQYLIGMIATDLQGNQTTSWLDPSTAPSGQSYANPSSTGAVVAVFNNTCGTSGPALSISKAANSTSIGPGLNLTYTLSYANTGSSAATNVVITDATPTDTTFVSATGSPTTAPTAGSTGTVAWTLPSVAAGASGSVSFVVAVAANPVGTSIVNSGYTIASDQTSATSGSSVTTPVATNAVLGATLSATNANGQGNSGLPGDTLTYTATVTNSGAASASGVAFTLDPATYPNLSLKTGSVASTGATIATGNGGSDTTISVDLGTLAAGASKTVTFSLIVANPVTAGTQSVSARGTFSSTTVGVSSATTNVATTPLAILQAEKWVVVGGGGNLRPGGYLNYTVRLRNTGAADITGAEFNDTLPLKTTYIANSATTTSGTPSYDTNTRLLKITGINLPSVSEVLITFRVQVDNPLADGTNIANQGTLKYGYNNGSTLLTDGDTVGQPTTIQVASGPNFSTTTKTVALSLDPDSSGSPAAGDTVTYTVKMPNTGDADAIGAQFTDVLPTGLTYVDGSASASAGTAGYTVSSRTVTWTGDVAAGGSVTLTFQATIDGGATGTLKNQGSLQYSSTGNGSLDRTALTDSDLASPGTQTTDLIIGQYIAPVITKTVTLANDLNSNNLPEAGDTLHYVVTIDNQNAMALTGLTFADAIPSNTTYVASSATVPTGAVLGATSPTLRVSNISVGGNTSVTIAFDVTLNDPMPTGVVRVYNQGLVGWNTSGSGTPNQWLPTNQGTGTQPTAINLLPNPTAVITAASNLITSGTATTVTPTFTGGTAVVGTTGQNSSNLSASPTTAVAIATGNLNGQTTYTLTVTNADGVVAKATTTVQVVAAPTASIVAGNAVVLTDNTNPPYGDPGVKVVPTFANATSAKVGTSLAASNITAAPTSGTGIAVQTSGYKTTTTYYLRATNAAGTTADAQVTITPQSVVVDTPAPANASRTRGSSTTFTTTVTGGYLGTVTWSATGGTIDPTTGVWTAPQTPGTYTITATSVDDPTKFATTTVTVLGPPTGSLTGPTSISLGCSATLGWSASDATSGVLNPGNVAITVSGGSGSVLVTPTVTTTYTLTLTGPGGSQDYSVLVTVDPAPAISVFTATPSGISTAQAVTFSATYTGGTGIITPGNFPIDSGGTYRLDVGPNTTTTYTLTVTAPCGSASEVTKDATVTVGALPANLVVLKSAMNPDGGNLTPGGTIAYTITLKNQGPTPVVNATFADPIPAHTTLVANSIVAPAGATVAATSPTLRITGVNLPAQSQVLLSFKVRVDNPMAAGVRQIANQATLSYDSKGDGQQDTQLSSDGDASTSGAQSTIMTLRAGPNLDAPLLTVAWVEDVDHDGQVSPGDRLRYRAVIGNTGNQDASGVTFNATLPANTTFVSGSTSATAGAISYDGVSKVLWTGDVPSGGSVTLLYDVLIQTGIRPGLVISEQGTVHYDPNLTGTNDTAVLTDSDPATPGAQPAVIAEGAAPLLKATKLVTAVAGTPLVPGDRMRYDIRIANPTNYAYTDVEMVDVLPTSVTFVAGSLTVPSGATIVSQGGTVRVQGIDLAAQASATISFQVQIASPLPTGVTQILNQAVVNYDGTGSGNRDSQSLTDGDPTLSGDQVTVVTVGVPTLSLTDAVVQASVSCGGTIDYVITVQNTSNFTARNAVLSQVLDPRTTFVSASLPTDAGTTDTWTLGTLQPGDQRVIHVTAQMNARLPFLYVVNHRVYVTSNGGTVQASARVNAIGCGP